MDEHVSFGKWLRRRRRARDLTQAELANRVGCATATIKKIEQDERRPSRQVAERLAAALELPTLEREAFVKSARAERGEDLLEWRPAQLSVALTATHHADSRPTALPTGTVTFLLTDLENSSRLWVRNRQAMAAALARHDALLLEAIRAHRGVIVKHTGDGVHAAFARAHDAVAAALTVQRAIQREARGDLPVLVRMALHTGAAEERDGDYYGPTVSRAARLLASGHGGQILLSRATAELVEEQLPPGATVRDLGQHRLQELARPEQILQLVAPGLPADFPPPKTVDDHPNNLPLQRDPLIGREREVPAVTELLARGDAGLVTLAGPGGIGKTRLALQVAAELLPTFPDGVWFVDLAPIRDPTLVAATILRALGGKESAGQPINETLAALVRDKQVLLVLDNFEQVVDAAPLLATLLIVAPRLKLLVTSRTALRVRGERLAAVPPLAVPDPWRLPALTSLSEYAAVQLFLRRARAIRPDLELTTDNAAAVAEICVRLDGMPLAIELAAARSGLLDPAALVARLQQPLQVLTRGPRDLPARQQTLRNTIDWSYTLLEPSDRALFRRLGVFVGGWSLPAAEAVCKAANDPSAGSGQAQGSEVLDGLESLLDKSLLRQVKQADGEPRFTMPDTIREFAREQLDASGDAEVVRRQHAACFRRLAEAAESKLWGAETGVWLARLTAEQDNLRAALTWAVDRQEAETALGLAVALGAFWRAAGQATEGRRWLLAALDITQAVADEVPTTSPVSTLREKALWQAAYLARRQDDFAAARPLAEETLALSRAHGDRRAILDSLDLLATIVVMLGDHTVAQALYEEAMALQQELGDPRRLVSLLVNRGWVAHLMGDDAQAVELLEESLALARQLGESTPWMVAPSLGTLAIMLLNQDAHERARSLLTEALRLARECGDDDLQWVALDGLARSAAIGAAQRHDQAAARRAARLFGAADEVRERTGWGLLPGDLAAHERHVAMAKAQLDEATWQAASAEGRAMPLDQAVASALEWSMRED